MIKYLNTPIVDDSSLDLNVGDMVYLNGYILTGRDAVLPKIVELINTNSIDKFEIPLKGSVIFHTAVSAAGIGPTSSNKAEIEGTMSDLSSAGVKIHLGKGSISKTTINELDKFNSYYAVTPPLSALLTEKVKSKRLLFFEELGMEALHLLEVEDFPIIIAAAKGKSIY